MYTETNISKLSPAQISRLVNHHSVRIKHGSGHKIHLSKEQHKKLMAAHRKGCGINLTLDPYQIDIHKQLFGHGMKGRSRRGKGAIDDFFNNAGNDIKNTFVDAADQAGNFSENELPSFLIHQGIPIAAGAIGSTLMPFGGVGSALGRFGGMKLADYVGQQTGRGMKGRSRRGKGMLQFNHNNGIHHGGVIAKSFHGEGIKGRSRRGKGLVESIKKAKETVHHHYERGMHALDPREQQLIREIKHDLEHSPNDNRELVTRLKKYGKAVIHNGMHVGLPATFGTLGGMIAPEFGPVGPLLGGLTGKMLANEFTNQTGIGHKKNHPKVHHRKKKGGALMPAGY